MQKHRQRGITIIEIMLTLAVVGITVTMGVPSFTEVIENQRQTTNINQLVMAMNYARSEAVKQTRHVTLCKSTDASQCATGTVGWEAGWIMFANTSQANTATREADEPIIRVFPPLDGSRSISTPDIAAEFISFRPTGTASISGTWVLCDKRGADNAIAVVVDIAGRAGVSHTQADASDLECPGA